MKLTIHKPILETEKIAITYSFNGKDYPTAFCPPVDIQTDDSAVNIMVNWLSIVYATLFFNIEYPDEIKTDFGLSNDEICFFEKLIDNGMAEFRYVNNIPIATKTKITPSRIVDIALVKDKKDLRGRILLNGGGKDGLTSSYLLDKAQIEYDLYQRGGTIPHALAARAIQKTPYIFNRQMNLESVVKKYKGHKPSSAIIAVTAILTAYLLGKKDVIASNETSANEANLIVDGVEINHQYTKTLEFENDFSTLLTKQGIDVRYFSLLRPLHELQIVKIFHEIPDFYKNFVSCNKTNKNNLWCMRCPKCAFIVLAFNAISPKMAQEVWGVDSINLPELQNHIAAIVDPKLTKPFDCVGTLEECQIAAKMILDNPNIELSDYLKQEFYDHTKNITKDDVKNFIQDFEPNHRVPTEYIDVLANMKSILLN